MDDRMWFHGTEAEWLDLAKTKYWRQVQSSHMAVEREFDQLDPQTVQRLAPAQFYRWLHDKYFYWKFTAANRLATTRRQLAKYLKDDPDFLQLQAIQRRLFDMDHNDAEAALAVATSVRGLGPAGGSGLLAVLFPDDFGTVDVFVVEALRKVQSLPEHDRLVRMGNQLTLREAALLIYILRRQARDLNAGFGSQHWTPRRVDMAPWGDR